MIKTELVPYNANSCDWFEEDTIFYMPAIEKEDECIKAFCIDEPCKTFDDAMKLIPEMLEHFSEVVSNARIICFKESEEEKGSIQILSMYKIQTLH